MINFVRNFLHQNHALATSSFRSPFRLPLDANPNSHKGVFFLYICIDVLVLEIDMKKILLGFGVFVGTVAYAQSTLDDKMEALWHSLPTSKYHCDEFDYFPDGGVRSFWCHLSDVNKLTLERITGEKMYVSGPHKNGFDFQNTSDFGRYNPKFVEKMIAISVPNSQDKAFVATTQAIYDKYVQKLARIHYVTYAKLEKDKSCAQKELRLYKKAIPSLSSDGAQEAGQHTMNTAIGEFKVGYYERWFYFMNPAFCRTPNEDDLFSNGFDGGHNGNVVKSAVGFWLRREMDGTKPIFAKGLKKLLRQYDQKWLGSQ